MVCMQQQTFLKWYEAKKAADPAFGDKTIFIDITSFNQTEINSRRRGRGLEGYPVFGEAPSDRGENWDLLIAINRMRGVLAGFVYEGHTDAEVVAACCLSARMVIGSSWTGLHTGVGDTS